MMSKARKKRPNARKVLLDRFDELYERLSKAGDVTPDLLYLEEVAKVLAICGFVSDNYYVVDDSGVSRLLSGDDWLLSYTYFLHNFKFERSGDLVRFEK